MEDVMLLRIEHETKLSYSSPVSETVFEVRMAPPSDEDQTAMGYHLRISPQAPVTSYRDGFGNRVDLFNITSHYRELTILAAGFVRTHRRSAIERLAGMDWPVGAREPVAIEAMEYLRPSPLVDECPALDAFLSTLPDPAGPYVEAIGHLLDTVIARLKYEKKVTTARTPVCEALDLGRGVCQDFAHLFIGACRGLGVPARYVSGYVNHPGEVATHAWCQVWAGARVGWVDVDPTRGGFIDNDHVVTAVGRDYSDVPPNRGLWKGRAEETMSVTVTVEPIERIPMEWNEWAPFGFRPGAGQMQVQRQGPGSGRGTRNTRSPYPNQRSPRPGLIQQQGEQQQQAMISARPR
jgi:transglutaminase-like putative cysteine protease